MRFECSFLQSGKSATLVASNYRLEVRYCVKELSTPIVEPCSHPSTCSSTKHQPICPFSRLSVGLGHTLQLVLLLDGIAVAATLGGVDQLFRETLGNALDVAKGRFSCADREESDGLVDAAERGNVDGLTAHCSSATDTSAVFAGAAIDDGIDGDLDRVLVGHDVNLGEHRTLVGSTQYEIQWLYTRSRMRGRRCAQP
jgi:hypothetical protein